MRSAGRRSGHGSPRAPGGHRDERGAATVLVLTMAGLLCVIAVALTYVAGTFRAQRSAQSAADLAAVAAAMSVAQGGDACAGADTVASANGAVLTGCLVDGVEVRVTVRVPGPHWPGRRMSITAEARAGPA